jgi:hypothetical protein
LRLAAALRARGASSSAKKKEDSHRRIPFTIVAIERATPRKSSQNTFVIEHLRNGFIIAAMMTEEWAVPANAIETGTEILSDTDAMLAEQLRRCHRAAARCFDFAEERGYFFSSQMEAFKVATKLMKSSLEMARALRAEVLEEFAKPRCCWRAFTAGLIALPAPAGCDFMSPDMRGQGAGPPSRIPPRES